MRRLLDPILGLFELIRLAAISRFRLRGAYWTWRQHTAFGHTTPNRAALIREALRFGAWARRLRRL